MRALIVCIGLCVTCIAHADALRGELEWGLVAADTASSWTRGGLGKSQVDRQSFPAQGHALLRGDWNLGGDLGAGILVGAQSTGRQAVDLQEAWLHWNPVPRGPWRMRWRAGIFFPAADMELGARSVGWTPLRTVSSSAINTWMGEELRTRGVELALLRRGALLRSPHDVGLTLAMFGGNDPAGTLLAWRGWSVGNRITGLSESLQLPDLPVYRPDGAIPRQTRALRVFREIDGRAGYYATFTYGYADLLQAQLMHYDNRGHPLIVRDGQYSWDTKFSELGVRFALTHRWELLTQWLEGTSLMGPSAVQLKFRAAYVLVSRTVGRGQLTVRDDRFRNSSRDAIPADPNGEDGFAMALAYAYLFGKSVRVVSEALYLDSNRAARALIGEPARQIERTLSVAVRMVF